MFNFFKKNKVTRGTGCLENFLAMKRKKVVDRAIEDSLRKGKILDIGCGSSPFFLNSINFKEKYGIDKNVNEENHDKIKIKKYCIDSSKNLPFNDNFFNVITLLAVIEHIDEKSAIFIFKEALRLLKLGGCMIMTTPSRSAKNVLKIMSLLNLVSREEIDEHKQFYTKKILTEQLVYSGFNHEKININRFELGFNFIVKATK